MIKNNKPLILYLIFNLMFYIILLSSFLFFEHEQKSQISNATTRLIREKFLIKDLTGLTRDIEKIRADNFTKIITLDNKNVIITKTVNSENFINLKIKRYIWSDSDQKNLKGVIIFYFSLDHILIITLKILFYSLIVTFPLSLMILSHLKKQQFEAIEIEKNKTLNKFTRQMSHDIRSPIASLHQIFESNHKLTDQEIKILKAS